MRSQRVARPGRRRSLDGPAAVAAVLTGSRVGAGVDAGVLLRRVPRHRVGQAGGDADAPDQQHEHQESSDERRLSVGGG